MVKDFVVKQKVTKESINQHWSGKMPTEKPSAKVMSPEKYAEQPLPKEILAFLDEKMEATEGEIVNDLIDDKNQKNTQQ